MIKLQLEEKDKLRDFQTRKLLLQLQVKLLNQTQKIKAIKISQFQEYESEMKANGINIKKFSQDTSTPRLVNNYRKIYHCNSIGDEAIKQVNKVVSFSIYIKLLKYFLKLKDVYGSNL